MPDDRAIRVRRGLRAEERFELLDLRHEHRRRALRLPATGVTGFLPTLVSSPPDLYPRAFQAFDEARSATGATARLVNPRIAER